MLTLLLCTPTGSLLDTAIARFEGSPTAPTHVALDDGSGWVIEDVAPVLRVTPAERFGPAVRRVPLTTTPAQEAAIVAYLRARVGIGRYDVGQLALDAAGYVTGHWLVTPWHSQAAVCSGVLAEAFSAAGILNVAPRDPSTIAPADLAAWVDAGQSAMWTPATKALL